MWLRLKLDHYWKDLCLREYRHGQPHAAGTLMHWAPCSHKAQVEVDTQAPPDRIAVESSELHPRWTPGHLRMSVTGPNLESTMCGETLPFLYS
jgi:hypothetical protein